MLTKFFAAEYIDWFERHVYHLSQNGLPFGLGGNSFYIRTEILKEIGGWDPFNVTEDAELSVRMIKHNIDFKLLPSFTLESCPNNIISWLKQRIRWNKGLLTTQLVHLSRSSGAFTSEEWVAFWLRMISGSALPIFTLFIIIYFVINGSFVSQFTWLSILLWILLIFSLVTSFVSEGKTFRKNGISISGFGQFSLTATDQQNWWVVS